uniref:Uncharacterized protein n=1 Tax=Arundo donax TaxID=35708 RepID=A0A0A9FSY5_ARUDO
MSAIVAILASSFLLNHLIDPSLFFALGEFLRHACDGMPLVQPQQVPTTSCYSSTSYCH